MAPVYLRERLGPIQAMTFLLLLIIILSFKCRHRLAFTNIHKFSMFYYLNEFQFHVKISSHKQIVKKLSLAALNYNVRSLESNFDEFVHLLNNLNHQFSIIGLSETKIKQHANPLTDYTADIPKYTLISQPELGLGQLPAGGEVFGFHIRNNLSYILGTESCQYTQNWSSTN